MTPWPRKKSEWIGIRVRSTEPLRNGWMEIARGTVLTVEGVAPGTVKLLGDACPCCGVKPYIVLPCKVSRSGPWGVEIVTDDWVDRLDRERFGRRLFTVDEVAQAVISGDRVAFACRDFIEFEEQVQAMIDHPDLDMPEEWVDETPCWVPVGSKGGAVCVAVTGPKFASAEPFFGRRFEAHFMVKKA